MHNPSREARALATLLAAVLVLLAIAAVGRTPAHADYTSGNVRAEVQQLVTNANLPSGGTFTSGTFKVLTNTITQSAAVQVTGTSPNYKVELLVTLDGSTFVKPETGSLLGTFTDANVHVIGLFAPLHIQNKLLFTELGSHVGTANAWEASQ